MAEIAIIGNGNVGSALARGLQRAGHEVRTVGKDRVAIRGAASWGAVVLLAVPFGAIDASSGMRVKHSRARRSST